MLLQTITINERTFPSYRRRADWIQKYIFPGSELASGSEILRSLARVTTLSLHYAEDIGTHYARTLASWRDRFHHALPEVRALGFDERFIRMWDYYLAYCEAAFLERHIGDIQLLKWPPLSRPFWASNKLMIVGSHRLVLGRPLSSRPCHSGP
jgi:cyclopropane-fatty-acyl-phospholipid synthase